MRIRGGIARRKGAVLVLVLVYGLGFFLVQGYRMPMFIVIRRKQDALSFRL